MEFELDPFSDGIMANDVRSTQDLIRIKVKEESANNSLWANRLENDLKRGPNFIRNEVGYEMSPEAIKTYLDHKSKYADDALMQSNFGAGVEGVRQGIRSLGIMSIDALGKAVGSETLTNAASMARWNDDERMEAYGDDFVKRNIASATRSITQVLGLTLGTYATGGALGAVGAPASLANLVASSNAIAVSAGFGLSTALDAYDQAKFQLPKGEAVKYAIAHGVWEGGTEYALARYMNLGMVAMANRPFMNTALKSGVKAADDALRASGKSLATGIKKAAVNVAAEEFQELTTMALQMADDWYFLDRDITPEQVAMTTADVLFSTLIATSGMSGYSAVRTNIAKHGSDAEGRAVRTNNAIDAAQSAFNSIYGRPTKNEKGEDVDGLQAAVDAITSSSNVEQEYKDLRAAQQVLFQFVGQEGRNKWNTEVMPKVLGHIAQLQAVEKRANETRMKDIPATEEPKTYLTQGPVAIPENAQEIYEATKGQPVVVDEQGNPVEPKPTQAAMNLNTEPARNAAAALSSVDVEADKLLSSAKTVVESEEGGRRKGRQPRALAKESEKTTATASIDAATAALDALLKVDTTAKETADNLRNAIEALKTVAANPDSTVYDIRDMKKRLSDTITKAQEATVKGTNRTLQNKVDVLARFGVKPTEGLGPNNISENDYTAAKAESTKMKEVDLKNAKSLVTDTVRQTVAVKLGDVLPEALSPAQSAVATSLLTPTDLAAGVEGTGNVQVNVGFAEEIINKYANEFLSSVYESFEVTRSEKNKKGQVTLTKDYLEAPSISADLSELHYTLTAEVERATEELLDNLNNDLHKKIRNGRLTIADLEANPLTAKLPKIGSAVVEKTESEAIKDASEAIDDSADTKEAAVARHQKYATKSLAGLVQARADLEAQLKNTEDYKEYDKLFRQWSSMNDALGSIIDRMPLDSENAEALKSEYLSMEPKEEAKPVEPKKTTKATKTKEKPSQVVTREIPRSRDKLANQMYKLVEDKISFAQGMIETIQSTADTTLDSMDSPAGKRATETLNQYTRAKIALEGIAKEFRTGTMTPQRFADALAPAREAFGFLTPSQSALTDKFIDAYGKDFAKRTKAQEAAAKAQAEGKAPKVITTNNPMWAKDVAPIYGPGGIAMAAYYGENTELGRRVGPHIQVDRAAVKMVSDIHEVPEETVMAATLAHEGVHVTVDTIFGDLQTQNKAMESVARDARGISELQDVVQSVVRRYKDDPRLPTNRTKESIVGEEILTKIAQDVVLGKRKLSAPEQNLWNKFKLSVRHWLLRTGYGRNLGMKWEGRDLDYFAYKLLMDKGYQRVPVFEVGAIGEGAMEERAYSDQPMFQFIGPNAELNGMTDNYLKAKQLANYFGIKEGEVLPKEQEENALKIARATGWFPGLDGKLQTWVDDSEAYIITGAKGWNTSHNISSGFHTRFTGKLGDVYSHPSIFKHYPELANVNVNIDISSDEPGGAFRQKSNKIIVYATDRHDARQILNHEIQHWIQYAEGFASGSNYEGAEVAIKAALGSDYRLSDIEMRLANAYNTNIITSEELARALADQAGMSIEDSEKVHLQLANTELGISRPMLDKTFRTYKGAIGEVQAITSTNYLGQKVDSVEAARGQISNRYNKYNENVWIPQMRQDINYMVSEASGVSNEVDDALVSVAQSVLALENSRKSSKKTFGDYIDALEATYGKELNWIKSTDETKAAEEYLKKIWNEQRAAKKSYPQQQKEQAQLKESLKEIGKMVRILRKDLPQMDFEGAKAAIMRNMIPDGVHDIRALVQSAFELVKERNITSKLRMLDEAGIPLNKNVARSVRAAYGENWNVSDTVVLQRAKAINDMGKITEEMLKDEIDEVEKVLDADPSNTEYKQIEKSLQDQLQRLRFGEVQTEPGSMGTMRDRGTRLWTAILKHSSIEGYLKTFKVPAPLITAIKAAGSVRPLIHDQLRKSIEPIAYAMAKDKSIHAIVNQHAILYAEGHPQYIANEFSKLPEKVQEAVVRAAAPIRGLYEFGKSLSESYGLDLDFQEHKIAEFKREIADLMKAPTKNKDRISELHERLALLHTTHYVNIAHKFIDKRNPKTTELTGRKTLTLYGLMKEKGYGFDEISTTDILVEYMDTLGRDIAVANIAREARLSAFAKVTETDKDGHLPDGWVAGDSLHSAFSGYMVDATIAEVLTKSVLNKDLGSRFRGIRTLFNIMKAKEFVNPAIMNVINTFQGTMLGIFPLQGARQAWKDVMEMTPAYVQAVKLNVFSRPNVYTGTEFLRRRLAHGNTPRQQVLSMILNKEAGKQVLQGDIMGGIKTLFSENTITGLYKASSELAWLGDEVLRMAAFNVLLKRGYSPEVAANHVARVYVDYADMPVPTRKYATMFFFTPVYAFETIRGMALNAVDAANSLAKISRGKATNADMLLGAKSMLAFAAGNAMITAIMMMGGFEPEDDKWWDKLTLGYKFVKPHTTKEGLQKELSVKIAGPYIVLQRELNRLMRGLDVETPLELPGSMFRSYATMQHPLFRNLASLFNMEDKFGNPMYEEHDSGASKLGKSLKVTAVDWVPMLGWALGNRGFVTDEAREAVLKDWYVLGSGAVLDLFMYPNIRDTKQKKIVNEMQYHRSAYLSSVRKHYAEYKTGDASVLKRLQENFTEKMDELTEKLNEEVLKSGK